MKIVHNYAVDAKQAERDELERLTADFERKNGVVECTEIEIRSYIPGVLQAHIGKCSAGGKASRSK